MVPGALTMANGYAFALQHARTWNRYDLAELKRLAALEKALRALDAADHPEAA